MSAHDGWQLYHAVIALDWALAIALARQALR